MAVTTVGAVCVRTTEVTTDTSTTVTLGSSPADGDVIVLFIGRSTGGDTGGGHTNASRTGFTLLQSFDPASSYDMYVDILYKESDGTEGTSHTVTMGSDAGEDNVVKGGWIWENADVATIDVDTWSFGNTTSHSWSAAGHAAGGQTMHMMFTQSDQNPSADFATGDTGGAYSAGSWRNGGFKVAGANTASGTYTSMQMTYGNVFIDEANALPSGTVTNPSQDERMPNADTAGFTTTGTAADSDGTVSSVTVKIDALSYVAATNTGTNYSTWSYATASLTTGAHTMDVKITDNDGGVTDLTQVDFIVNAVPTVVVSTPTASQRFTYSTTSQVVTGTSADDLQVSGVDVRWKTDGGAFGSWFAATNTGTNYSTWSYTITGLAEGEEIDLEARSDDGSADVSTSAARKFFVNDRVTIGGISSPTESQIYPANDPTPDIVLTGITDDFGNRDRYSYRLTRDSDGFYWDGTSAWQAGSIFPQSNSGLNDSASTYTFQDGVGGIELPQDLGESEGYQFRAFAWDSQEGGVGFTRNFDIAANVPLCAITTPPTTSGGSQSSDINYIAGRTSYRESNETWTSLDLVGTSSSSGSTVDYVEARIDHGAGFGAWANVTNTGTAYSTWSQSYTIVTGEDCDIEVRAVDLAVNTSLTDTMTFELNAVPTMSWTVPADEAVLANGGGIAITLTANDNDDDVVAARIIKDYVLRVIDETDGTGNYLHWNGSTWVAGADTAWQTNYVFATTGDPASDTVTAEDIPSLVTAEGKRYRIRMWPRDGEDRWGAQKIHDVDIDYIPAVCTIVAPTDGQRDASGTVDIAMSGTASSTAGINKVEVSRNGGSTWFTATGTTSWNYTFASVATDGDTFDLRARATDTELDLGPEDSASFAVNALPVITSITGLTDLQELAANAAFPTTTFNTITDDLAGSNITKYRNRIQRASDSFYWDGDIGTPAWVAGSQLTNSDTVAHAVPVTSYAFTGGVDGVDLPPDLGINQEYTVEWMARDDDDEWSLSATHLITIYTASVPPTADLDQVTGNHDHTTLLTGTSTVTNPGETVTAVEVRMASGAWAFATNTGTNFNTWQIDPGIVTNWPVSHQLDGGNDPITMAAVLVEVRATDSHEVGVVSDSATLTPTLPAPTVSLTDERLITGTMSDASITEVRILRTYTAGGAVDEMWTGSWVANDSSWQVITTNELLTTFDYTQPTWLISDDIPAPDDRDVYTVEVRARNQTSTVTDGPDTLDTDWPTWVVNTPTSSQEFTDDPATVALDIDISDATGLATTHEILIRRHITAEADIEANRQYLNQDFTTWATIGAGAATVDITTGTSTSENVLINVPADSGYTYQLVAQYVYDTHGNRATWRTLVYPYWSVESEIVTAPDDGWTTPQATLVSIDVLANDTDIQSDAVITIETPPATGTAVPTGVGLAARIEYTPTLTYNGAVSFTYRVTNGDGGTGVGTTSGYVGLTPPEVDAGLFGATTQITRRGDMYENPTGIELYAVDIPITSGSVTVDANRAERRRADIGIYNDGNFDAVETELWYDKIIKISRGVVIDGADWLYPIFTGKIEKRSIEHVGNEIKVSLRDMSIVLAQEFGVYEEYPGNFQVESVIEQIALAGGLPAASMNLTATGVDIGPTELVYTPSAKRWDTMRQLAESNELDLYFDAEGVLQLVDFPRTFGQPLSHVFRTGADSNIGAYTMNTSPTNIFNIVAVVGEKTANDRSYYGVAENTSPTSPTRVSKIGRRPITISRPEITSDAHAQAVAELLLDDYSKESFDITSVVIPDPRWEANTVVQFPRLNPAVGEINRYVLESFSIDLTPGPASIKLSKMQSSQAWYQMALADVWLEPKDIVSPDQANIINRGVNLGTITKGSADGAAIV